MPNEISNIIQLFHKEEAIHYELKEIWMEEHDCRWIIYVDFPEKKFVIKIASNDFTTKERINGWVAIIDAYRDLGCYSPAIKKSLNGNYAETILFREKLCVVWEEEYAKYYFRNMLDESVYRNKNGRFVYHDEILEFLGRVAQKHYNFFPYKSGWVRLEPFGANETTDEITACVETFDMLVRKKATYFIPRWEKIYALFEENKAHLAEIYPKLPTSVFQGDHFESNLLLGKDGHFKGLIDYNLAGTDTFINVVLYTILYGVGNHDAIPKPATLGTLPEYNPAMQDWVIQNILDSLRYLRKFYTFNEAEAQAILPLYKYISCIEYTQINAFKKYQQDEQKLNLLFDTIEAELMREENRFYNVMLS